MAPTYKLHYFNYTALGEPVRFLLAYGDAAWEDVRYERSEWPQVKSKMPHAVMPVLEIDGKAFAQSAALARYLAREFGLDGKDNLENLQIDMAADLLKDLWTKIMNYFYDKDPASKAAKKDPLQKEQIPFYMNKLEEMIKDNGGYLVNGKLTWADIYFVAPLMHFKLEAGFDFVQGHPTLQALVKKVESVPSIARYIAQRPDGEDVQYKSLP